MRGLDAVRDRGRRSGVLQRMADEFPHRPVLFRRVAGDVLDRKADDAPLLAVRRCGVVSWPRNVCRKFPKALANRAVEQTPVLAAKAIPIVLEVSQVLPILAPFDLGHADDKPISRSRLNEGARGYTTASAVSRFRRQSCAREKLLRR